MLQNYLKIALRNLLKEKRYSFINLLGLSVGVAVTLLITLYVKEEWTFDIFHSKSDRIYRAWVKEHYKGDIFFNTVTPIVMGPEMRDNFPEIEILGRYNTINTIVKKDNFSEQESIHLADPSLLGIFDFKLLKGIKENVLDGVHQAVITEDIAKKYFGDTQPTEQTFALQINGEWVDFTISGIIEKAPSNSSIQYDIIVPFENMKAFRSEGAFSCWTCVGVETYALLREGVNAEDLVKKMAPFFDGKVSEDYKPGEYLVGLQPLTDIHLNKDFPQGIVSVSDSRYPYILAGIALLILALACINFTTLAIGRSVSRAKEVGMRKVTGATRWQLMGQFWSEAIVTAGIAVLVGVLLAELTTPFFNSLADKQLDLTFSVENVAILAGLALTVGLLAGIYPALILSGFAPLKAIHGKIMEGGGDRHLVLRALVGVQFVLSIGLIGCTFVMQQQMHFLQNKNLGFEQEQVLVVPYQGFGKRLSELRSEAAQKADLLRNEMAGTSSIKGIAVSSHTFGAVGWASIGYTQQPGDRFRKFNINGVDENFIPLLGLELLEGRNFSKDQPADQKAVVINETYAKAFDLENPVGQPLQEPFQEYKIIGLAKDFNFESLHTPIEPLVLAAEPIALMRTASDMNFTDPLNPKFSFKISGENVQATIGALQQAWKKIAPEQAFSFTFMDENIDNLYRAENRLSRIVSVATFLAIFIACLGLFGIATLTIARRTKEIGIRKVLGASAPQLVVMVNRHFTLLVLLAAAVAAPLSWYFMKNWLDDFAFRIDLSPLVFALAAIAALVVAWLAVSFQSIKAALTNPVKSLRNE